MSAKDVFGTLLDKVQQDFESDETFNRCRPYASVLEGMLELLGSDEILGFGDAYEAAAEKAGFDPKVIPDDIQESIMIACFKIIATGRVPGCPDA